MSTPTIIRAAVSQEQCKIAATELHDAIAAEEQDPYVQYKMTPTCANLARQAHEVHASVVYEMETGVRPKALIIATFRTPASSISGSSKPPGSLGKVYFAIALTTLSAETGILNFFPKDDTGLRLGQEEVLQAGDGIVCRQEDFDRTGGGEGGVVLMIRYQAPERGE